jgi:hypothetical protein
VVASGNRREPPGALLRGGRCVEALAPIASEDAMTRTIKPSAGRFAVIYRGAVERLFETWGEAKAYIQEGQFPSVFDRRGGSPFERR